MRRALVVVISLVVLLIVETSGVEQLGCRQVAEVFESHRLSPGQRIPVEKIDGRDTITASRIGLRPLKHIGNENCPYKIK